VVFFGVYLVVDDMFSFVCVLFCVLLYTDFVVLCVSTRCLVCASSSRFVCRFLVGCLLWGGGVGGGGGGWVLEKH